MSAREPSDANSNGSAAVSSDLTQHPGALHRLLIDSVVDYAIFALTPSGEVASWNVGAQRLKGYEASDIIGKYFSIFYPPEERNTSKPREELEAAEREGRFEEEGWRVRKDGSRFWANVIVTPLRSADGVLLGFAKITRDLTSRREAEQLSREAAVAETARSAAVEAHAQALAFAEALRERSEELEARNADAQSLSEELVAANEELLNTAISAEEARDAAEQARRTADELQQRYHRIFESSPLPMWTARRDTWKILEVNDAAVRRYGYSRDEFLKLSVNELRAPGMQDEMTTRDAPADAEGLLHFITRHRTKRGELIDVDIRAREIVHDRQPAFVAVVTDISAQLRANARQQFLIGATELLSASLEYERTLDQIVRLSVPVLADWAAYNVREDERIRIVSIYHPLPEMQALAAEIDRRYPQRVDAPAGVSKVIATGEPELIHEIPDEVLAAVAYDDEHYRMLKSIGFRSLINVPIASQGVVIGALSFATGESGRLFEKADLDLAIELARRASLALDNARLFEAEFVARTRAERSVARLARLQEVASILSGTLDMDSTSHAIVQQALESLGADAAYVVHRCPDPSQLELVHGTGYPIKLEDAHARFAYASHVPGATAVRENRALWLETPEARDAAFPDMRETDIAKTFPSSATLPLSVDGVAVGAIGMHFLTAREFTTDDQLFFSAFAEQVALAVERARLYNAELRAREIAERMQTVTAALSEAVTPEQVTALVITEGLKALGAGAGSVAYLIEATQSLEVAHYVGYHEPLVDAFRSMPLTLHSPLTDAVRTATAVWLSDAREAEQQYPELKLGENDKSFKAWATLPLTVAGKAIGAIGLSFSESRSVLSEEREFMLSLARQCAQAIERSRLYEAERLAREAAAAGQRRAEFLAEASRQLGATLDYEQTLQSVATAAVPVLGDWCAVDMFADPASNTWPPVIKRLAVMHQDKAKIEWARELQERQPVDWSAPGGLPRVLREGVSEFYPIITDEFLAAAAKSDEELALLREIGFTGFICVPLRVRGRTVGGVTFCMTESGRNYNDSDLALAEELALRASLAIENAELYREAQHANAAKAQFLAVMSHELRTPLNAIGGYAELLEMGVRGELTAPQLHDIGRIRRSQHHLLALINDVLNFARIEAGHVQYRIDDVPVSEIMDEVVSLLVPQARARELTIEVRHCENTVTAHADGEKVQQVLLNLLSNAVKFTLPGGEIVVSCSARRNTVELSVSDTGIGIPDDKLSAIFDPFVQVQSGLTRNAEGTGLGLSISRDLARGMHGDLRVESNLGKGSVFTLTLPRSKNTATPAQGH